MKKLVLGVDLRCEKEKKKAMSKVSGISGVISVAIDMKEKKMTVIGEVEVTSKLRKLCHAEIVTLGENKEEKKDECKKEEGRGGGGGQVVEPYPWFLYPYAYPQVV